MLGERRAKRPSGSSIGSGAAVMRASYATLADEGKERKFLSFLASIRN